MSTRKGRAAVDWVARMGLSARFPGAMMDLLVASVFINILSLALPITLLQIYDRILPNESYATLSYMMLGALSALVLELVLRYGRSTISAWIGARFDHLAGCAAMERLFSTNIAAFEREGTGVHLERLNALGTLREFYSGQAMVTLFDLPFALLFLAVIAYLAGSLVLVPIILVVAFAIAALRVGFKLRRALAGRLLADDRRFDFIIEVLGGIHTIKGLAMETQMVRRYERLQEACANADYEVTRYGNSAIGLGSLFSQLTMFSVVAAGSLYVMDGLLTVGGLAACTLLSGRAMQPLQRAVGIWTRFQSIRLARERAQALFEMETDMTPGLPRLHDFSGRLELRDVHFRYRDDAPEVLNGASMEVHPGEMIGISGGNNSGKTTLLYLMMGSLRPTTGEVLLDGHDTREIDVTGLRDHVAYLPQTGVLFNGTILENITMFRDELEPEAMEAARILKLDEVVMHMPHGYESKVGDGAADALPRGIKQRIAISRALLADPRMILFDEANTAMDSVGDAVLREALLDMKGKRTLVMVTHRPSMLKLCDRVFDLSEGQLVERDRDEAAVPPALTR